MYLFANRPTVDTLACKPTYQPLVAVSVVHANAQRFCSPSFLFYIEPLMLRSFDFTFMFIRGFVVYLNIIEWSNQLEVILESYYRTKWSVLLFHLSMVWQLRNVLLLSWETDLCWAPATTRLTPQLVGSLWYLNRPTTFSTATNHKPYIGFYTGPHMNEHLYSWVCGV